MALVQAKSPRRTPPSNAEAPSSVAPGINPKSYSQPGNASLETLKTSDSAALSTVERILALDPVTRSKAEHSAFKRNETLGFLREFVTSKITLAFSTLTAAGLAVASMKHSPDPLAIAVVPALGLASWFLLGAFDWNIPRTEPKNLKRLSDLFDHFRDLIAEKNYAAAAGEISEHLNSSRFRYDFTGYRSDVLPRSLVQELGESKLLLAQAAIASRSSIPHLRSQKDGEDTRPRIHRRTFLGDLLLLEDGIDTYTRLGSHSRNRDYIDREAITTSLLKFFAYHDLPAIAWSPDFDRVLGNVFDFATAVREINPKLGKAALTYITHCARRDSPELVDTAEEAINGIVRQFGNLKSAT